MQNEYKEIVQKYLENFEFYHCFETPNIHWLNEELSVAGQEVCFMAEYYLPDVEKLRNLPCNYELRILQQSDF